MNVSRKKALVAALCACVTFAVGVQMASAAPTIKSSAAGVVEAPWGGGGVRTLAPQTEVDQPSEAAPESPAATEAPAATKPAAAKPKPAAAKPKPAAAKPKPGVSALPAVASKQYCADQKKTFKGTKTGLVFQEFHCTLPQATPVFSFDLTTSLQGKPLGTITEFGTYTFTCQKKMLSPNPAVTRPDGTQVKGNYWVNIAADRKGSDILPTPDEYHGWVPASFIQQAVSDKPLAFGPGQDLPTCA